MRCASHLRSSAIAAASFLFISLTLFGLNIITPAEAASKGDGASAPELDIQWPGRVVAVGDLHGDASNALLLLDALGVVDRETRKWKGGKTLLIQTGDIVDRGPDGKILYDLFATWKTQAAEAGGKVVQLLGNHDAMNVCGDFRYVHPSETAQFGGISGRRAAFSEKGKYGAMLLSLASAVRINGIIFSHAGVSPSYAALGLSGVHQLLADELKGGCALHYKKHRGEEGARPFATGGEGPLWTRLYTMSPPHIACPALEKALGRLEADVMVVGHTVQESLNVETHCAGRLIAIDTGISRFVANSPRAIEVTDDGTVYEVAVQPAAEADAETSTDGIKATRRKLSTRSIKFYQGNKTNKKEAEKQPEGKGGNTLPNGPPAEEL